MNRPFATLALLSLLAAGCSARAAPATSTASSTASSAAPDASPFALEPVTDGLWRYTTGSHHGVLLVTDRSAVVTDPISQEAATWLRAQIAERFDRPLRYVIYSHNHPDHAYGGQALDGPGVTFIAHELAAQDWERTRAQVRMPDITFDDRLTVIVDGHRIELRHHGRNNGLGSVSMRFASEEVLHVVDWAVVGRVPYRALPGYDVNGMLDSNREILALDFETFVGGHGDIGDRAGVQRSLDYLESLHDQVLDGLLAGKDLDAIRAEVDLSAFSDLARFEEWRDENVEGVYRQLVDQSYVNRRPEVRE